MTLFKLSKQINLLFLVLFLSSGLLSQTVINGIIKDIDGGILRAAIVDLQSSLIAKIADNNGEFEIEIPNNSFYNTLSFSRRGMQPAEFKFRNKNSNNFDKEEYTLEVFLNHKKSGYERKKSEVIVAHHSKAGKETSYRKNNIRGNVKYSKGNFPGALIKVEGTTQGTITDLNGNFELIVPNDKFSHTLVVSYKDFKDAKFRFSENTTSIGFFTLQANMIKDSKKNAGKESKIDIVTYSLYKLEDEEPSLLSNKSENKRGVSSLNSSEKKPSFSNGNYYALIIGVEDYKDNKINDLDKPISDARSLYDILASSYSFSPENITFLKNPGRNEITQSLEYYFDNIGKDDNLLIFYAGHGYWDERFQQGYWLASDADKDNRGTWLPNSTIRDYLRAIPSKHTLLITDACFGGGIFKSRNAFSNGSVAVNQLYKLPSRKAITSGALSEVPDKSVFIEYLVKRLKQNEEKYLSSEQLFSSFKIAVINNSSNAQVPQFGEVRETGDEGGDFIFIKK
ncbi:carboxypeptidase-like regulatory domain-containing protein [Bacteroidota bacterium]